MACAKIATDVCVCVCFSFRVCVRERVRGGNACVCVFSFRVGAASFCLYRKRPGHEPCVAARALTAKRSRVPDPHVLAPGAQGQPGDVLHSVVAPDAMAVLVAVAGFV